MFTKIRFCDAVGKTIQAVEEYGSDIVIAFADQTYVALHARQQYDDAEIVEVDIGKTCNYEARHAAVKAGAMTNEEEISQRQEEQRQSQAAQQAHRRRQFEQLKREFGE